MNYSQAMQKVRPVNTLILKEMTPGSQTETSQETLRRDDNMCLVGVGLQAIRVTSCTAVSCIY
jgi:hypothetical protein